jgi:lysozyme family protein
MAADFKKADKLTGINEGGYANDPDDRGGETYAGIARNFWGKWLGWKYIDQYKADHRVAVSQKKTKLSLAEWVNASAKVKKEPVEELVNEFYRVNFWELNRLGDFKCQALANTVYDYGVNAGKGRAARLIQQVTGGLLVDGVIGRRTIEAINSKDCETLYKAYNAEREKYYRNIAKGRQAKFLRSWLSRLLPFKDHRNL